MRYARTKTFVLALTVILLAWRARSQDVTQSGDKFSIKTGTQIVLVNVQVRDSKGNFVRELKQDDFTITEDGKVQKVLSMDIQNTDALTSNNGELQALNLLGGLNGQTASQIQQEVKQRAKEPSPVEYTKE